MSVEETCPHCKADLRSGKIPEADKEFFGGDKEYFSRLIGIVDNTNDGVSYWCCPECWTVWNRCTGLEEPTTAEPVVDDAVVEQPAVEEEKSNKWVYILLVAAAAIVVFTFLG